MSIRACRIKVGYSQAELANLIGVSDAAVCMWETGKTAPRAALLPKLAALMNCTVDDLLKDDSSEASVQ